MHLRSQLLLAVSILYVLGLVMIFNTSSAEALDHLQQTNTHQALLKQLFYGVFGVVIACTAFKVGYKRLFQYCPLAQVATIVLLLAVFIPGLGITANGARRWVNVFGMSLQPSEFTKYIAPLYFAYRLMQVKEPLSWRSFLWILLVAGFPVLLILLEPNNGTAGVVSLVFGMICFLSRVPLRYWAVPFMCIAIVGGVFALQLPYVTRRIQVYLNPELDLKGKGHQPHQAKLAAGSGGLFGKGPGKSLQKLSYLPEAQNDYIAAIFAEEFGFIGMLVLLGLYAWIGSIGFSIALSAKDWQGLYLASIIAFLCTFQAFLNLGVVSGLVPSTGLNLPFFSQGGSSLLANIGAIGILLSISKQNDVQLCQIRS